MSEKNDYMRGWNDGYDLANAGRPRMAPDGEPAEYYEGFNAGYADGAA